MLHHLRGVRAEQTRTTLTIGSAHYNHLVDNLNLILTYLGQYKNQGSFKR